jgi:hypothetical protein
LGFLITVVANDVIDNECDESLEKVKGGMIEAHGKLEVRHFFSFVFWVSFWFD